MNTHVLNANEAAGLLRISRKTLARMIRARAIPSIVIGRRRFFSSAQLARWVADGGGEIHYRELGLRVSSDTSEAQS